METQRRPRKSYFFRQKKKVCMFCARGETIDYKDTQNYQDSLAIRGKSFQEESLVCAQNIKDRLPWQLKEQELWHFCLS